MLHSHGNNTACAGGFLECDYYFFLNDQFTENGMVKFDNEMAVVINIHNYLSM